MKRSEMLDEMVCCLFAYSATYPQYPLEQLLLVAKEILEMQEKKGMLPPSRFEDFGNYRLDMDGTVLPDEGWINEWEEEDET